MMILQTSQLSLLSFTIFNVVNVFWLMNISSSDNIVQHTVIFWFLYLQLFLYNVLFLCLLL